MKEQTINGKTYLFVEVPEDSGAYLVPDGTFTMWNPDEMNVINLPDDWDIIGRVSELTEEQWKGIVESWPSVSGDGTMVYQRYPDEIPKCRTATESGLSLIESLGYRPETTLILIKK